jgi:hypothetical protein
VHVQVRHLVLQPGVSYSCLKGMVSSHVAAGVMDFSRFERHIAKQDPKELLPQVIHCASAGAQLKLQQQRHCPASAANAAEPESPAAWH